MVQLILKLCLPELSDFTRIFSMVKVLYNRALVSQSLVGVNPMSAVL